MSIRGSCHCGKIAYTLDAAPTEAIECNCSICRRRGYLLAFAMPEQFHLDPASSRDDLTSYTFGKHAIHHLFCSTCGCAPFGEGTAPDGKSMVALNLRCAEGLDLSAIAITPVDGASF